MKLTHVVASIGLAAATSAIAAPVVVADTLGPNQTYDSGNGWGIGGIQGQGGHSVSAMPFTASASGELSRVLAPLSGHLGAVVTFELRLDDNWGAPGTILATADTPALTGYQDDALYEVLFDGPAVHVTAGTKYWLSMSMADPLKSASWAFNDQGIQTWMAFGGLDWQQPGGWNLQYWTAGAYRVEVEAIPEPATWTMLGIGIVLVAATRRRRAG